MWAINTQISALVLPGFSSRLDGYIFTCFGGYSSEMMRFSLPLLDNSGLLSILPNDELSLASSFNLKTFLGKYPICVFIFDNESRCIGKSIVNSLDSNGDISNIISDGPQIISGITQKVEGIFSSLPMISNLDFTFLYET